MAITRAQVATVREVVRWYLATYYGGPDDAGLLPSFSATERVGHMAIDPRAIASAEPDALFRLLVSVAMFQRLRDVLVQNILRGLAPSDVKELTTARALLELSAGARCAHAHTNASLIGSCDLTKDQLSRRGTCSVAPSLPCYLKRHTELLRRYGHFGKVPTSIALTLAEHRVPDLNGLRERVLHEVAHPLDRAQALERMLSGAWRVNQKIASMFLALVTAPDLGLAAPPWASGVDWTWFVVVDSNVDLFLVSVGYDGATSYDARRGFVRALAERIDLSELRRGLEPHNPRLVQQAMFMFMSRSNRLASASDCSKLLGIACTACPRVVRGRCSVLPTATVEKAARSPSR